MNYTIHITNTAQRDILNAADYIEFDPKKSESCRQSFRPRRAHDKQSYQFS